MNDATLSDGIAIAAFGIASVQAVLSPYRDIGVVTLSAVGVCVVLARGFPTPMAAAWIVAALVMLAIAWLRGAAHGVGRPGLAALGILSLAIGAFSPFVIPDHWPPSVREHVVQAAVVWIALAGAAGLPLSLERPGPRRVRPVFFRKVEVGAPTSGSKTASSPSPSSESAS